MKSSVVRCYFITVNLEGPSLAEPDPDPHPDDVAAWKLSRHLARIPFDPKEWADAERLAAPRTRARRGDRGRKK